MPLENVIVTNFTSGELSPRLRGRVDLSQYFNGARTIRNMVVHPHGGVTRRGGSMYIAEVKDSGKLVRLIPFQFSVLQSYILEFGDGYIRVYRDLGQVLSGGNPVEISTPYTEAQLFGIDYAQSADVLYLAHQSHAQRKLTRTSDTSWTLSTIAFTSPPSEWTTGNYPGSVAFYEQRLYWAGTPDQPQTLWGSKSGDFENHDAGSAADDEAVTYTIASDQVNAIRWISPGTVLVIGTAGGEFVASGSGVDQAITPASIRVVRQTRFGSALVRPVRIGNVCIFVDRQRRKVRELVYRWEDDAYASQDLTLLAEHITAGGVVDTAYAQQPDSILWCCTADGRLIGLTYEREQRVIAWHRQRLGGSCNGDDAMVESVAVIPGSESDELWMVVKRTIDGQTRRYIEVLAEGLAEDGPQEDGNFVDSGLTLDNTIGVTLTPAAASGSGVTMTASGGVFAGSDIGRRIRYRYAERDADGDIVYKTAVASIVGLVSSSSVTADILVPFPSTATIPAHAWRMTVTSLSGLDHLEGETVQICGDGAPQPEKLVSAGAVTLDVAAATVHVGLGYASRLRPMPPEAGARQGTAQGKAKRISRIDVRLHRSLGFKVGRDDAHLDQPPFRAGSDAMDAPPPLFSGDQEVDFSGDWDTTADVLVVQDQPLPLTVLALMPDLVTHEG